MFESIMKNVGNEKELSQLCNFINLGDKWLCRVPHTIKQESKLGNFVLLIVPVILAGSSFTNPRLDFLK